MTHRDKSAVRGLIEELLATDLAGAEHRGCDASAAGGRVAGPGRCRSDGPDRRRPLRAGHRSGRRTSCRWTRPKQLATPAGQVELVIPKLREGVFFPEPVGAAQPAGSIRRYGR